LVGANPADTNAASTPALPYDAEITGDDVYIRSGPGTNYYNCGKLNKGDKVRVVNQQFSWSCIMPPPGSFSWIYTQYVSSDADNPGVGIVNGDSVRVYAGSDDVKPIHSTLQLKLDKGEKVRLLGEQKENYYKIAPPTGAYLWVSTQYTKPVAAIVEPEPVVRVVEPNEPNEPSEPNKVIAPVPPKVSVETKMLAEYRALQKQLLAERAKPIGEQDYAEIKKAMEAIAKNKEAGRAARYCEFMLRQIERYELAQAVSKEVALQNKQLEQTQDRIDKARSTRLAQAKRLGRYAVVGKLQPSNIYGPEAQLKRYRIVGDSGKTLCYARPIGGALQADVSRLIGKKVGLLGEIEPHPQTGGALVKFTEIAEIK
jgi:uncharacterized protein YraI